MVGSTMEGDGCRRAELLIDGEVGGYRTGSRWRGVEEWSGRVREEGKNQTKKKSKIK